MRRTRRLLTAAVALASLAWVASGPLAAGDDEAEPAVRPGLRLDPDREYAFRLTETGRLDTTVKASSGKTESWLKWHIVWEFSLRTESGTEASPLMLKVSRIHGWTHHDEMKKQSFDSTDDPELENGRWIRNLLKYESALTVDERLRVAKVDGGAAYLIRGDQGERAQSVGRAAVRRFLHTLPAGPKRRGDSFAETFVASIVRPNEPCLPIRDMEVETKVTRFKGSVASLTTTCKNKTKFSRQRNTIVKNDAYNPRDLGMEFKNWAVTATTQLDTKLGLPVHREMKEWYVEFGWEEVILESDVQSREREFNIQSELEYVAPK